MKRQILPLALAAIAVAPSASALTRTFDGTGEAVLLPYYHAGDGESTVFSVTNHSDKPKAVRVVVVEGRNGRPALAFNLYLAARDSWHASINPASVSPTVSTTDDSCTVPLFPARVGLQNFAYSGTRLDGLGRGEARLHTGSIELIEMGVPTGVPAELIETRQCQALVDRFNSDSGWRITPNAEVGAPSGGLSGEAQIIDVAGGVAYHSKPVVLDDFSFAPRNGQASAPDYNDIRFFKPKVSPDVGVFLVDGGARVDLDRPADAVSLTLMSTAFETGFLLGDALDASTRVVVTLPTRAAYLDNLPGGELPASTAPIAPFNGASATAPYCIGSRWQAIDRTGHVGLATVLPLCEQVNVVDLAMPGDTGDVIVDSEAGRVRIDLQPQLHALEYQVLEGENLVPRQAHGLPAVVQSLSEVKNANARQGVLASYAISHDAVREHD